MSRRKRKRPIPNAGEVARSLTTTTGNSGHDLTYRILSEQEIALENAIERGRTIGRLEGLADGFDGVMADANVFISGKSCHFLAPILRAEIERLKGAKP